MADVWKRKGRKARPWVADYTDGNGKRHRLSAATKEQAHALLVEKTREAREIGPTVQTRADMTVANFAQGWLRQVRTELKHASVKSYAQALRKHLLPAFGNVKLRDLTHSHVKVFITEKREAGYSKNSIHLLRSVLSAMLGDAIEEDPLITKNAAKVIGRRKRADKGVIQEIGRDRPFGETEVPALLTATRDLEERALLMTLARAGLRPGELLGLQWTDLNFSRRKILVERAFYDVHLGSTKTGKARTVDMSQELAAVLSALYIQREREKLQGRWPEIPEWIFCSRDGQPLLIDDVRKIFDYALRHAGLSGHVPYDLRHTFASRLLAKGVPLTYTAKQMGHSKATITLQYYAHWVSSGDDHSYVDALDDESTPEPVLAPRFGTTRQKVAYRQGNLAENNLTN